MADSNSSIVVKANAVMSAFNVVPGRLTVNQDGLDFLRATGPGFIEIDWSGVEKVSVQIILGFYWRGIYVETKQGEFEFITARTRKLVKTIGQYIDKNKIVQRKAVIRRKK